MKAGVELPAIQSEGSSGQLIVGIAAGCCVVALFASFVLVSRLGLRSTLAPPDLLALRFLVAGLVMTPVFMRNGLLGLRLTQALGLALTGGLGFAAFAYSGFALAPASHGSSLIHGTLPLSTLLIAIFLLRDRADRFRLIGTLVILLGIVLLVVDSLAGIQTSQIAGDLLLLGASFCWSMYGILARRYGLPTIPAAALVAVLSAVIYLPMYGLTAGARLVAAPIGDLVVQALFQGLAIGVLSLVAYTKAVTALGAENTALFAAFAPALTTLLAILVLGEMPTALTWLGVICVSAGIVVATQGKRLR